MGRRPKFRPENAERSYVPMIPLVLTLSRDQRLCSNPMFAESRRQRKHWISTVSQWGIFSCLSGSHQETLSNRDKHQWMLPWGSRVFVSNRILMQTHKPTRWQIMINTRVHTATYMIWAVASLIEIIFCLERLKLAQRLSPCQHIACWLVNQTDKS